MTKWMHTTLSRVPPRALVLALVLAVAVVGFEGWYLLLRKPLVEYRRLTATTAALTAAVKSPASQQAELNRLQAEVRQISERVAGELRLPAAEDETASFLMTELDRTAARDGVVLTGVKPGGRRQVLGFEEVAFEVGAQGKYLPLCQWLRDFRDTLGQGATVTDFEMTSIEEGGRGALSLKLALYRPPLIPGAGK